MRRERRARPYLDDNNIGTVQIRYATARATITGLWTGAVRPALLRVSALWLLAPALAAGQVAPVEVASVERRAVIEALNLTGTLTSPSTARLSPDVEGRLVAMNVDAGQRVQAGETLFRLDDELARLDLRQAVAAEHEAEAELADAERRYNEVQALVRQQSFPESEARSLATRVERSRAILERRRAERARAAAMVERYTLKAPFDGVIASRNADLGERVNPDSDVLRLVAVDRLQLDLRVPQGYFGRVGRDTPVTVKIDALQNESFQASISRIVPVSDPDARTFLVRADLDNSEGRMTPGMSARAVLRIGTGRQGLVVPRDALIRYPDGRTVVWVARGEGGRRTVEERLVETGLSFDGNVEIVDGLSEGESVVVRGNEILEQGQEVRIAGES